MTNTSAQYRIQKETEDFYSVVRLVKNKSYWVNSMVPKSNPALVLKMKNDNMWTVSYRENHSRHSSFNVAVEAAKNLIP